MRTLELLVAFPPEDHVYRLIHGADGSVVPEPVPQGWTWAKAQWSASLWWSFRGLGWNYGAPLASSMTVAPYTRHSKRSSYLVQRALCLVGVFAAEDLASSYMRVVAPDFFLAATTPYSALSTGQRAGHSIAVVTRIVTSIEVTHILMSLACVAAGGIFGISTDNELFSPWGWPPLFGSLGSIVAHPGIGYMWTRVRGVWLGLVYRGRGNVLTDRYQAWHQYNRRMLHSWGWVLLGERVLRLPPTGEIVKNPRPRPVAAAEHRQVESVKAKAVVDETNLLPPTPPPDSPPINEDSDGGLTAAVNKNPKAMHRLGKVDARLENLRLRSQQPRPQTLLPTPPTSGRSSPVRTVAASKRQSAGSAMGVNLAKSLIVFTLSGLHHDYGSFIRLLDAVGRGDPCFRVMKLTPFFAIQPLALAFEAVAKHRWRAVKRAQWGADYKTRAGAVPAWVGVMERVVGLVWMWMFLGWSAGWFVEGLSQMGVWRPWPGDEVAGTRSVLGFVWNGWAAVSNE